MSQPSGQVPAGEMSAAPSNEGAGAAAPAGSATAGSPGSATMGMPPAAGSGTAKPMPAAGMSGAVAAAGATAGADAAGAASGSGGAGMGGSSSPMGPSNFADCKNGDAGPCGTFTTQSGVKIMLGPYGAVMEQNVGKGFEVRLASGDSDGGASCSRVVASFGEDPESSKPLLDTEGIDFALFTVYRPASWAEGEKVPIITWGNGTCAKTEGYGTLLRYVASHGFFVIAANSRWTGGNGAMTKALDFAQAANEDSTSPYYQRLDLTKVGAMGHSQGGGATITAARDERVKTVIIWNGGSRAVKPYLAVTGDMDIGNPTVSSLAGSVTGTPPGAFLFYHMVVGQGSVPGHLTLMTQPERVIEPTVAWFKYQLQGDMPSRDWFVGTGCKLCKSPAEYEYGQKGLP